MFFSYKFKAKKWLVSFEDDVNTLTQELIKYFSKLFNYIENLSLNMHFLEQIKIRDSLDFWMQRYWRIYNADQDFSIGREVN